MWFPVSLWTVFTMSFLTYSSLAYSSSHNSYPDYETGRKEESRSWTALEGPYEKDTQGTKLIDLSSWPESDAIRLSRHIFGDKSAESAEALMNRGFLDAEDFPKDKRESPALSIVNPLDVLRQRLQLEMARRRQKQNQDQIRENAVLLKNLGKRSDNTGGMDARTKRDYLRRIHASNSEDFEV